MNAEGATDSRCFLAPKGGGKLRLNFDRILAGFLGTSAQTSMRARYPSFIPSPAKIFGTDFSMRAARVADCLALVK
jgi:hypothetical protein